MLIQTQRGWELPEVEATPEAVFRNRRTLVTGDCRRPDPAGGRVAAAAPRPGRAWPIPPPGSIRCRATRRYALDRELTAEDLATTYNNFYEFGSSKDIEGRGAGAEDPALDRHDRRHGREADHDRHRRSAEAQMPLEERLYRHRCVEAWSMAVPWSGFPLKALVDFAARRRCANTCGWKPSWTRKSRTARRRSLVSLALYRGPDDGRGDQRTRLHGHRHLRQADAEAERRAAAPRDAVEIRIQVDQVDRAFHLHRRAAGRILGGAAGGEYGFWANVNPEVPHPRWSQATERVLGTGERVPTLLFNGYGEYVADLYKGLENERLCA